jgi:SAM-dependent MidA family methyltransferase
VTDEPNARPDRDDRPLHDGAPDGTDPPDATDPPNGTNPPNATNPPDATDPPNGTAPPDGEGTVLPGWREAAANALYGPGGFYLRPEGPAGHFRTSVHASRLFAAAVARLLCRVDEALGHPAELAFVDMGAGHGELVTGVLDALPADVASRTRGYAVERAVGPPAATTAPRPETATVRPGTTPGPRTAPDSGSRVTWRTTPPPGATGLLFANEWLDNVPLDVVETDAEGTPRRVLVREDGTEVLGGPVGDGPDARWLNRWWPMAPRPGLRAEIGRPRDAAWAAAVGSLSAGLAVFADYGHLRDGRPPYGTLTGFREGREVPPVPDGSCDITAHVALDACAKAGTAAGSRPRLLTQREALHALGVSGARPPLSLASSDPTAYVRALATAGEAAELTAPEGLGAFGWLLQPVGMPYPPGLPDNAPRTGAAAGRRP